MSTLDTTQTAARNAADRGGDAARDSAARLAHTVSDAVEGVSAAVRSAGHDASDSVATLGRQARQDTVDAAAHARRRARRQARKVNRRASRKINSVIADASTALDHATEAVVRATPAARAKRSRRTRFVYTAAAVSTLIGIAVVLRQRLGQAHPASVRIAPPAATPDVVTQGVTQAPVVGPS